MKKHNRHAVDYDEPLGISKWEWIKVLGGNLALVLLVYTIDVNMWGGAMNGCTFYLTGNATIDLDD